MGMCHAMRILAGGVIDGDVMTAVGFDDSDVIDPIDSNVVLAVQATLAACKTALLHDSCCLLMLFCSRACSCCLLMSQQLTQGVRSCLNQTYTAGNVRGTSNMSSWLQKVLPELCCTHN